MVMIILSANISIPFLLRNRSFPSFALFCVSLSCSYHSDIILCTARAMSSSSSSSSSPSSIPPVPTDESSKPIAAIAQLRSTSNKFQNLVDVAICARLAKSKGASMLFLPECFGFIGESSLQTLEEAEDPNSLTTTTEINTDVTQNEALTRMLQSTIHADGSETFDRNKLDNSRSPVVHSLMDGLRIIAKEADLWISGGGMHVSGAFPDSETDNEQERVYNTHVIVDSDGILRSLYRKIHLFDVSIPGKVQLQESKTTAPGTELVTCDSPIGRLGLTTCYDLRFPEMYIELVRSGAQILLVPSAFTIPTGAAHWHTLLRGK